MWKGHQIFCAMLPTGWLLMTQAVAAQTADSSVAGLDITHVAIDAANNSKAPSPIIRGSVPVLTSDSAASRPVPRRPQAFKQPPAPFAKALNAHGVSVNLSYLNISAANPTGGVNSGSSGNSGTLQVGADLDMQKAFNIPGGTIHFAESLFMLKANASEFLGANPPATLHGHFFAQDVGSALGGQPFPNNSIPTYLSTLSYEHQYKQLDIEVGRLYKEGAFDIANDQNIFSSGDPVFAYDNATPPPPYGTWAGRFKYSLPRDWFVQAGAYEDDLSTTRTNGFRWNLRGATGAFSVSELGYNSTFADAAYPGRYEFGGYYDSATFTNPYSGVSQGGTRGAFFRGQQTVWRADGGLSQGPLTPHVNIFASASGTPDTDQRYRVYAEIGINYDGPFKSRPFDEYSLKIAYLDVNRDELEAERAFRVGYGGSGQLSRPNQFRVEANGHFAIVPGVAFEPVAEYIFNPNTMFSTAFHAERTPKSGIVLGGVLTVDIGTLLGLSLPPP